MVITAIEPDLDAYEVHEVHEVASVALRLDIAAHRLG
ncbi:hypothetical protein IWX77_001787 [Cryobacterium sp. CAN_C2]